MSGALREKLQAIQPELAKAYGRPRWQAKRASGLEELVSCILSQSTTDLNRDRAYDNLRARFPTWQEVVDAPAAAVIEAVRSAGLANQKGPRIQALLRHVHQERGEYDIEFLGDLPLEEAREWLLSLVGVGPKTAAIVLCFSFNRAALPVDTHVHRVALRLGLIPAKTSADRAHGLLEELVDAADHYAFHLQLIRHGREVCSARSPQCTVCTLREHCDYLVALEA
ncbi:MAG: endonuclease III [Chloroflexi bacterium]|nr:endonuclease III [Anaerolineaceae bacterium]MCY4107323.1 endonuclease III [Chloroflexota bacterium]